MTPPLRLVPAQETAQIIKAFSDAQEHSAPEWDAMLSAVPPLTAAQVDEITDLFHSGARHWMRNERGALRFNSPRACLKRIEDRTRMRRFLTTAFGATFEEDGR